MTNVKHAIHENDVVEHYWAMLDMVSETEDRVKLITKYS